MKRKDIEFNIDLALLSGIIAGSIGMIFIIHGYNLFLPACISGSIIALMSFLLERI